MAKVQSRKTRTLSLRLSAQEFESLKSLYALHGARSVSEFARSAMQSMITRRAMPEGVELKIQEIDGRLRVLDSEVARLVKIIESELDGRRGLL